MPIKNAQTAALVVLKKRRAGLAKISPMLQVNDQGGLAQLNGQAAGFDLLAARSWQPATPLSQKCTLNPY
jgi:hypothetical protein